LAERDVVLDEQDPDGIVLRALFYGDRLFLFGTLWELWTRRILLAITHLRYFLARTIRLC
jgi:hypothetical protein